MKCSGTPVLLHWVVNQFRLEWNSARECEIGVSEPLGNVSIVAVGIVGVSENVGGQFWHLGIHAVIVTPGLGSFKWQSSPMLTLSYEN